ncbi:F-box protein [Corchorus olitorius]|uniref:F-box protein n=1 Tax=Corchorus olitorius TaxID=93759 RepID=A0A1R3KA90_9ROSI|nr:F-box protein [Corchorus olitorius]
MDMDNMNADMGNMSTTMDNMRLDPASPIAIDRISELPEDVMNQRFVLKYCWSPEHLLLRNLPKLKTAFILGPRRVEIAEGVNIQELDCFTLDINTTLDLCLVSFDNLKKLRLSTVFTESNTQELIDNSPHLETLILSPCNTITMERFKISSQQLRDLQLDNLYHFGHVEIDAPNLEQFRSYINGGKLHNPCPSSIFVATTRPLEAQFCVNGNHRLTNQSFQDLRNYFQLFKYNVVCIDGFFDVNVSIVTQLKDDLVAPPLHLDRLELRYSSSLFDYASVLDYFLGIFRPTKISVTAIRQSSTEFTKFLLVKFLTRAENPVCCSNCRVKCWRHYLENVKIRSGYDFALKNSSSRSVKPYRDVVFTLKWTKYI